MNNLYDQLKQIAKEVDEKCDSICEQCPMSKTIFSDDYGDWDICDMLEKLL